MKKSLLKEREMRMTKELFFQAILKFIAGVILIGLLIFIPAGTIEFWNGWLFMGILFVPMFGAGIVMMVKNPELLKKRLNAKEKQKEQNMVIKLSGLMFGVGAGFDYHAGKLKRAPKWMQKMSLEWLVRLCQDPRRLWKRYLVTNVKFIWYVLSGK